MNWPDPGSSSLPSDDDDDALTSPEAASGQRPGGDEAPSGVADPTGRTPEPDAQGTSEEAVWLSSDDLASSPRPWEDRDPAHLPVEDPGAARPEDAEDAGPARETPTYAQLRSEADGQLGRWERTDDGPVAEPPGGSDASGPGRDGAVGEPPEAEVPGGGPDWHADGDVRYDDSHDEVSEPARDLPPGGTPQDAPSDVPPTAEPHGHDSADSAPYGPSWDAPEEARGVEARASDASDDERRAAAVPVTPPADTPSSDPRAAEPVAGRDARSDLTPVDVAAGSGPPEPAAGSAAPGGDEPGEPPHAHGPSADPDPPDVAQDHETTGDASHGEHAPAPGGTTPGGPPSDPSFHGERPEPPPDGAPFHGERAEPPSGDAFHGERPGEAPHDRGPAATVIEDALADLEETARSATVICVANQKGGVGKTTTTVSLGAALAMEGAQVLVVDLDPQGNATTGLGLRAQEGAPSTYRVIVEQMDVEDAAEPTAVRGLHVLPSSLDLAGAEIELVPAFSRENRLKQALDAVRDLYDVILIDCPPSLGLLTINALVAADQVLVPIQCEYYALEGLGQLMRTVKLVADSLNRGLAVGGVVLTMFDGRTNLSQQVADEVRGYFGEIAYQTIVPRTVRLSEAPSYGQPIGVFDAASRGARAYQRLAREVARRLDLELETEEVSPLDRLLGSTTPPASTDEASPLPTDLAPEDVPEPAQHHTPPEPGPPVVEDGRTGAEQGTAEHHDDGHHHDRHHHDEPVPGTEGQP